MGKILGVVVALILIYGLSFLACGVVIYGICWAFGLTFSWKITFGIWLILAILSATFKSNVRR